MEHGSTECAACPSRATCPNGDSVVVSPGGWRTGIDSKEIYECPQSGACIGGNGTRACLEGHKGPKCAVCEAHHFFSEFNFRCKYCDQSANGAAVVMVTLLVALAIASLVGFLFAVKRMNNAANAPDSRVRKNAKRVLQFWDVSKFKVLWSAFQITTSVTWTLDVSFPEPFSSFQGLVASITQLSLNQVQPLRTLAGPHVRTFFRTLVVAFLN